MIELPRRRQVSRRDRFEQDRDAGPREEIEPVRSTTYVYEWPPGEGPETSSRYDRRRGSGLRPRSLRLTKLSVTESDEPRLYGDGVSAWGRLVRKDGTPGADVQAVYPVDEFSAQVLVAHEKWASS